MRKQSNSMSVLAFFMAFIAMALFFAGIPRTVNTAVAAPSGTPGKPEKCNVCTELGAIDEKLDAIDAKLEPLPCEGAPVAKTGQTTSYEVGDDGNLEMGVAGPEPRFTDNGNGTVTDNLTGLIWLKNANRFGDLNWESACDACNSLADNGTELTDGSSPGDWRLPNVRELHSLIDYGQYDPALPDGHPFSNVQSGGYWSSTTVVHNAIPAWGVGFYDGYVGNSYKDGNVHVWCVRGGQ